MDISDIATSEYRSVAADERLGSIRSILGTSDVDGVLVTDAAADDVGVITTRDLLRSHYSDDTKAGSVATSAPELRR